MAQNPRSATVFTKYNIDYCCGGKISLTEACSKKGINPEEIKQEIEATEASTHSGTDFNSFSPEFLIDYIVNIHHTYLYDNLGQIEFLVQKVYHKHGERFEYLKELAGLFTALKRDLLLHLPKEEEVIFPFGKKLAEMVRKNKISPEMSGRSMENPIRVMFHEHEDAGEILFRMREITNNYTPPAEACNSHLVMLDSLKRLDADLIQHIHLENNILFPKIQALELSVNQKEK